MAKFHLPTIEQEVLARWDEKDVFHRLLQEREKSAERFVFFEGPPTANGKPGLHHVLARSFKDAVLRYWTMRGYRIDRKAGWDTHGLPVELEVEKQLGFTKKQDIEDYGIAPFNEKCRESVWKYRDLWEKMTRRTAFWVDMEHPYVTYENGYVESLWNIMKKVDGDGRLYQGYRVTPHCPRCVTSLSSHELAQGYKDVDDPSVFVRFRLKGEGNRFLLVWTTTPWTLPANVAVAVGANVDYVEVKPVGSDETLILARSLTSVLDGGFEITNEFKGSALVGKEYEPLFVAMPAGEPSAPAAYKVYAADFVSTADGTGLVHIAPAFGEDDGRLGKEAGLPTLLTVDGTGFVTADVPGKGKFFKKADTDIIADLEVRGLLYKRGTVNHSYPFCWRCDTPILYYAKTSWYIRMSDLRDELLARNEKINWVPDNIKEGRFGEWLREVKDWAISRERYWGTPLPLWQCDSSGCDGKTVVGSLKEMEERTPGNPRVFLARHGEAETNATGTIVSLPEPRPYHLTDKGREQVRAAAARLKEQLGGKAPDAVYCSPLTRTKETAAIYAEALGFPADRIQAAEELKEIGFGEKNGGTEAEYHACFADKKERFAKGAPGGESLTEVRRRMVAFVKGLRDKHRGETVLVVSHGDPLWLAKTGFDGLSDDATLDAEWYPRVGDFFALDNLHNLPYDQDGRVDVHRPFIDEVKLKCEKCGGAMSRVKDVMDVWFDSGAMPYAQWHYPFENAERIDPSTSSGQTPTNYPADYICEAIDQTRGWFYTLLAVSTLLGKEEPPYRNVICLGHILDAKGKKMSKSKGNVVEPFAECDRVGADAIRYYLFTLNQPGEYKRYDPKAVEDVVKKNFMILWNVLSFYQMYARLRQDEGPEGVDEIGGSGGQAGERDASVRPTEGLHALDQWVLSELSGLHAAVDDGFRSYDVVGASRAIGDFVTDLSTWYVRRSRDRFKAGGPEAEAAVATLGYVLHTLARLMAPFTPFLADALYKEMGGKLDSVHLDAWPTAGELPGHDDKLHADMNHVRSLVSLGLEQRAKAGIPVRQALTKAIIRSAHQCLTWGRDIIVDELNVHGLEKEAITGPDEVVLDTVITPELRREGAARELVRHLNDWRKQSGLTIQDRIVIAWQGGEFWRQTMAEYGAAVASGTLCDKIEEGSAPEGAAAVELEVGGEKISLYPVKL